MSLAHAAMATQAVDWAQLCARGLLAKDDWGHVVSRVAFPLGPSRLLERQYGAASQRDARLRLTMAFRGRRHLALTVTHFTGGEPLWYWGLAYDDAAVPALAALLARASGLQGLVEVPTGAAGAAQQGVALSAAQAVELDRLGAADRPLRLVRVARRNRTLLLGADAPPSHVVQARLFPVRRAFWLDGDGRWFAVASLGAPGAELDAAAARA